MTPEQNFLEFGEFRNLINPVSNMCLVGAMIAYFSLSQEVAGLSPFTVMTNLFVTQFSEFSENI